MLISVYIYNVRAYWRTYIHTAWATVLFVQLSGQYQSLYSRNSNIAVPLFLCIQHKQIKY